MSHHADVWETTSTIHFIYFEGLLENGWEPYAVTTRRVVVDTNLTRDETTWHLRRKTGRRVRIGDD